MNCFLLLTGVAASLWYQANQQKQIAEQQKQIVENKTKEVRVLYLNSQSKDLIVDAKNLNKGILLAIESIQISKILDDDKLRQEVLLENGNLIRQGLLSIPNSVAVLKHNYWVIKVIFSPDGKYIATASWDNTARLWIFNTEDLINEASNYLTRNLTPDEWKKYMGDEPYHKTFPNLP